MPITKETIYRTSDGSVHGTLDEANRWETQGSIAADLSRIHDETGDMILKPGQCDSLAWHAKELLAILKKHLEQQQADLVFAMTDQEAYDYLRDTVGKDAVTASQALEALLQNRAKVASVLALYPDQQRKRFDPIEAPIDEERAGSELFSFLADGRKGIPLHGVIDDLIKHRREVVMILQGIERPAPISLDEALNRLEGIARRDHDDVGAIVAEIKAIADAVRP